MALVVDTSVLFAAYRRRDARHEICAELLTAEAGQLIVPAPIIPEVDFFLSKYVEPEAQHALYHAFVKADYLVADLSPAGYARVAELNERYADLRLGFVDAAVMTIAEELGLGRIATLDRRHFGAVTLRIPLHIVP